jgi:hypothetical protein
MKQFLWAYVNPQSTSHGHWQAASLQTANAFERKPAHARTLQEWSHTFLADRDDLPVNPFGKWNESILD